MNIVYIKYEGVLRVWDDEKEIEHLLSVGRTGRNLACGLSTSNTFWYFEQDGYLTSHDVITGRILKRVSFGEGNERYLDHNDETYKIRPGHDNTRIFPSKYDNRIFIFRRRDVDSYELDIVCLESLDIIDTILDVPTAFFGYFVDQRDSFLLWDFDTTHGSGLLRFCKTTRTWEHSPLREYDIDTEQSSFALVSAAHPSPCGQYWLRPDNMIPTQMINDQVYFGISVQIWEAFPLKFLKRQICTWICADELPLDCRPASDLTLISTVLAQHNPKPEEPVLNDWFPEPHISVDYEDDRKDESEGTRLVGLHWTYSWFGLSIIGWQPDSGAFWLQTNGYLSCVGLDGSVSARLCSKRVRMLEQSSILEHPTPNTITPLPDRRARVQYYEGRSEFDGTPSEEIWKIVCIGTDEDKWEAISYTADRSGLRAEWFAKNRGRIEIVLHSRSEADCIQAIEQLRSRLTPGLEKLAHSQTIKIKFKLKKQVLTEKKFFQLVAKKSANVSLALAELISTYASLQIEDLYSNGPEGEGLLAFAALALAKVDPNSFDLLEKYGILCDPEHEYVYAKQTAKALLSVKAYSAQRHEFAIRFMISDFYNSVTPGEIWNNYGVGKAAKSAYDPAEYAKLVSKVATQLNGQFDEGARFRLYVFDDLYEELSTGKMTRWEDQLFRVLEA